MSSILKPFARYLVVCFRDDQVASFVVDDEFSRSVVERKGDLVEDGAQLLEGQNPQSVGRDGDDAFGALLRREPSGILQRLVREGGQVEPVLKNIGILS